MRSWIKKHIGLSIGIGIVLILLLVCSSAVLILNNYSRINKLLWEWNKPEKYYIKIHYEYLYQRCLWTSESIWQDDKLLSIVSNEISGDELCAKEEPNIADWSMNYIFDQMIGNCGKGTVFCAFQYDSRFHYPSQVNSLYHYVFEVQDFVACDKDKPSCP